MIRLSLFAACLLVPTFSCRGTHAAPFVSDLKMSDVSDARQLMAGFWDLENGQWRWAKHRFAVVLQPPPQARQSGATLILDFSIPPTHLKTLGPFTVSADIGDTALAPQTFTAAGSCRYTRPIEPDLLTRNLLPVVFTVDKFLRPEQVDGRELSIVVTEVALH